MRFGTGLVVLGVSAVVLGWVARSNYATYMQTVVTNGAEAVVADAVHGASVLVEGRDITVTGLADGAQEHSALIAALDAVRGRRVLNDELEVLPTVDPYRLTAIWENGTFEIMEGHAPTRAAQETLAALGAGELPLAAGAPDHAWGGAAARGLQALRLLESGQMSIVGRVLSLSGTARTPEVGAEVRGVLDLLPEGYRADMGLSYVDDGTPAAYQLHYAAGAGAWVEGKLPPGVSVPMLADALNLAEIDNSATQGIVGDDQTVPAALAGLGPWMADFETLDVDVTPDGISVDAGVGAGADRDLVAAALAASLGTDVTLSVSEVTPEAEDGARRVNAATGRTEVLRGGFWLPVAQFEPGPESCPAESDAVLAENRIGFVTGSARLDARARGAVNALAAVLDLCVGAGGMRAEIGGHTDSTGSPEANLALSQARADAVREALIARGIAADALAAQGYGAEQPIADNETEEGRAANRRTAIRWIE